MTLRQAVQRRMMDIRGLFQSEHTEHTGRLRYHEGTRSVSGRIGGAKKMFPELANLPQSPKVIARAIERGKGKVYRQVYGAVEHGMIRAGYEAPRSTGRRTVDPHKGKRYCTHCRELHTRGQHRFHGKGSFQQTHLFSFNPRMRKNEEWRVPAGWQHEYDRYDRMPTESLKREYLELTKGMSDRVFGNNARNARKIVGRILRERGYYWIENDIFGDIAIKENRPMKSKRRDPRMKKKTALQKKCKHLDFTENQDGDRTCRRCGLRIAGSAYNPRRRARCNPPGTRIYGKVLRIEAQKTGKHLCDSACKKAGHRYYHDFRVKPSMYGLPDGSLLIKK